MVNWIFFGTDAPGYSNKEYLPRCINLKNAKKSDISPDFTVEGYPVEKMVSNHRVCYFSNVKLAQALSGADWV